MKKILITGATDGIGKETAKQLALAGHHLLLHGRSKTKLASIEHELKATLPSSQLQTYQADLSDITQVKQLAKMILAEHKHIDGIINNAGIFKTSNPVTNEGMDARFVVNTLSPYILTTQLLPLLSAKGRVINVSSAAQAPLNLNSLTGQGAPLEDFSAYAQSKLGIIIWSEVMSEQLQAEQVVVAVNPGSLLGSKMVQEGFGIEGHDLSIGANILIKALLSDDFANASGKYFDNDAKQFSAPHSAAQDPAMRQSLMSVLTRI